MSLIKLTHSLQAYYRRQWKSWRIYASSVAKGLTRKYVNSILRYSRILCLLPIGVRWPFWGYSTCPLPSIQWTTTYSSIVSRNHLGSLAPFSTGFCSFLRGRTQQVVFNGLASTVAEVTSGVPQGSVLGPLLFLLYTALIPVIASEHGLGIHCYADDGQLYVFGKANCADQLVLKVTTCIGVVDAWMSSNRLKLNSDKTQFIWLGSQQQLQKIEIESVALLGDMVVFQPTVNDLGVTIDGPLTMREHVQRICRASYYQLRQLRVVRNSLSTDVCVMLLHAFVSSRLDYCNSLLAGVSDELVNRASVCLAHGGSSGFEKAKVWSSLDWPTRTFTLASPFVRESSTSSDYWSTSVCMVWLHRICPTCLHWSVPIHTVVTCDLLLMVIWPFPGHERCEWVLVVSLSLDQNFGTPWHRN